MRFSISPSQRWLLILLAIYAVLGISYSIVVPLAETPDESEHFRYMQVLTLTGQLPVMQPQIEDNFTQEAHQPPLYYLAGAALFGRMNLDPADNPPDNPCFSFQPDDPGRKSAYLHSSDEWFPQRDVYRAFLFMRWLSVLMGAATICFAYIIGRQVVPTIEWFAPAAAALLAFNPQFIFVTASMSNDVPTTLLGATIVALSSAAISRPRLWVYILLGIAAGMGMLSKFALIAFWPLALLAAVWPSIQVTRSPFAVRFTFRGLIGRLWPVILLPLLIAGWWYFRNYQLYGDPLIWAETLAAKGAVIARTAPFAFSDLVEFLSLHFQSYWLWFGWLNIKAPDWVYGLLVALCLAAAAGLVRLLLKRNLPVELPALSINGLAVLAIYASLLQYIQTVNWTGYQGRLAFAAAASIAMFIALGLAALAGRRLLFGVAGGMLILAVSALLLLLLPSYPRPEIYQPAKELTRTCARFDGGLQVEAVAGGSRVAAGDFLPVTVYGYGLDAAQQPQMLTVRLRGADGQEVGHASAGVTWRAGEVVGTEVDIPVSADALPARAVLDVVMSDEDGRQQNATSATARQLDVPVSLQTVKIAPGEVFRVDPQIIVGANFGDQMTLLGYDLDIDDPEPAITLYWQARESMVADYTTFVHIIDGAAESIAQNDSQPTGGVYPTSIWDKGEIVADRKEFVLPQDAQRTELRLAAGVYQLETMERLPVWDSSGRRQPDDRWLSELPDD